MSSSVVNPRLIDYFDLTFRQDEVDFAIPHLSEDLPLYLDPFLLWSSESAVYQQLHEQLLGFFEQVCALANAGRDIEAHRLLLACQESRELGLGYALGHKRGASIGPYLASAITEVFRQIPQVAEGKLSHIEVLQLVVPGVAEDRISDLTAGILKSYLIEFTSKRAVELSIPTESFTIANVYDHDRHIWLPGVKAQLPQNPLDHTPLLFAPLDMLRHLPWINYEDYYRSYYMPYVLPPDLVRRKGQKVHKAVVLAYNRANYTSVQQYVGQREREGSLCRPDPLFEPLKIETLRRKYEALKATPTGMENENDKKYEKLAYELLASLLYPEFEFAADQVRTISGVHIRDIIFHNSGRDQFAHDLRGRYDARQVVFELKNVRALERDHVNQLYRYLDEEFGRFGILMTRNRPPTAILKNTIDLHSSKRIVILCLDDTDLELMLNLIESGERPIRALQKKYVEFLRLLPK